MGSIFIGFDKREKVAYDVCKYSIESRASKKVDIKPLILDELRSSGLYYRTGDPLASTEFTYSRFLVPYLSGYDDWAIFVDCDFLFLADIWELIDLYDPKYAIQCVKHEYTPSETTKMDGVPQTNYPRKNWSSLILWNCAKNTDLTVDVVNKESGAYLHRFQWLNDEDIGEIPYTWNFLEGWYSPTDDIKACHFTGGGAWFKDYQDTDHAHLWKHEYYLMTGQEFEPPQI